MPVLQILQLLAEHDRVGRAVAVDQRDRAARFMAENRLGDRQHRRDTGPRRDQDVVVPLAGKRGEASLRRHHPDRVADGKALVDEAGEPAVCHPLDADAQRRLAGRGADRIGAPCLLSVDVGSKREVLAGTEGKGFLQRVRYLEGDSNRLGRLARDRRNFEIVKSGCHDGS